MNRQQGESLIIVVILLVVLMISALALVRSSETVGAVAGNVAFKQAATEAGDVGIAAANGWLTALTNAEAAAAGVYYATRKRRRLPGLPAIDFDVDSGNRRQRLQGAVRRRAHVPGPAPGRQPDDPVCLTAQDQTGGSKKAGSPSYSGSTAVFYRVTVRVKGPRNSESYVQSLLSK